MDKYIERRYWNENVETMPQEQLREVQEKRLLVQIAYAYHYSPLMRRIWKDAGIHPRDIGSLEDYGRVPTINKDRFRVAVEETGDPSGGALAVPLERVRVYSTTGTTGKPTFIFYTDEELVYPSEVFTRCFWEAGLRPGDRLNHCHLPFFGPFDAVRIAATRMNLSIMGTALLPIDAQRIVESSVAIKPQGLWTLGPPMIPALTDEVFRLGYDPKSVFGSYKAIFSAGDKLTENQIRTVREIWGTEIFELAGLGELNIYPTECREHNGLHNLDDLFLVEVLHLDRDEPVPEGERGELCITPLFNQAMPFLRWRTDDIVQVDKGTCSCGRTHTRVHYLGRLGFQVQIGGKIIFPYEIQVEVEKIPELDHGMFQIVRYEQIMERLRLRVGHRPSDENRLHELEQLVIARVSAATGLPVEVEWVPLADLMAISKHKLPRVVDLTKGR